MDVAPLLDVHDLGMSFGAVRALDGVSLTVRPAEIHAVLGQNGAGKSTLVKLLNGVYSTRLASGTLTIRGQLADLNRPADARNAGIGYVPQEIEVVDNLTVAENIFTGRLPGRRGMYSPRRAQAEAATLLERFELPLAADAIVANLSSAQRQLVMIARALALAPDILMLDEPTTSLSGEDARKLGGVLSGLRARGMAMIYITHRIAEVMALCDRTTVLRDGRVAATFDRADFDQDRIVDAMVGRRFSTESVEVDAPPRAAPVLLKVRNISAPASGPSSISLEDISFDLHEQEILGLAGLVGSGRSELLGALFGRTRHSGQVWMGGRAITVSSPGAARRAGFALLAEDRKREGLLFNQDLVRNVTAGMLGRFSAAGLVRQGAEERTAVEKMTSLAVKAPSHHARPQQLSGGNQQKLLFARVLVHEPKILLLDEPTKGVDVGTRHEIYRVIRALRERGTSIVVVSSDLDELLGLADRCVVLSAGRVVDEFARGEGDEARILRASAGLIGA